MRSKRACTRRRSLSSEERRSRRTKTRSTRSSACTSAVSMRSALRCGYSATPPRDTSWCRPFERSNQHVEGITMTTGKLIVVTGPAAVGKSTVTKALQKELTRGNELWLAIELDVFARSLPRPWIAWGDYRGRNAAQGFVYARRANGSLELELGADGRRVLSAFHRSVAAVVTSGVGVICESI